MENSQDRDLSAKQLNRRQLLTRGAVGVSSAGINYHFLASGTTNFILWNTWQPSSKPSH